MKSQADLWGAPPGEVEYEGTVVPKGGAKPAFLYRRFCGPGHATHVTREPGNAPWVLWQHAEHDAAFRLLGFEERHRQRNQESRLLVEVDRLRFERRPLGGDGATKVREEPLREPVVVGPTLFGFVRTHLDALRRGKTVFIRFAAADQGRTYRFGLRAEDGPVTRVTMRATSWLVRLGIAPMTITFEEGRATSYCGRVPPLLKGSAFDAEVRYRYL